MTDIPHDLTWEQRKDSALYAIGYLATAASISGVPTEVEQCRSTLLAFLAHVEWLVGEEEHTTQTCIRLGELLERTANVIKGSPTEHMLHSTHNLPESALLAMNPNMRRVRAKAGKLLVWWSAAQVDRGQPFEDRYPVLRHDGEAFEGTVFAEDMRGLLEAIYGADEGL